MSASGPGSSRVRRLFERAAAADSLLGIIVQGIGAVFLAFGAAIASGIFVTTEVVTTPLAALGNAGADLVDAIFGGSALIIDTGAITTALSLGPNGLFNVGFATFALSVGAVLLALYLVIAYLSEEPTGNFVPGIPFDIPTPGFGGPEEDDEE